MSFRLRLKYRCRSLRQKFSILRLPRWFDGLGIRIFLAAAILLLAGGYMLETSRLSTSGYKIYAWEEELADIAAETKRLEIELAAEQSMTHLEQRLAGSDFSPPVAVTYRRVGSETTVAKR